MAKDMVEKVKKEKKPKIKKPKKPKKIKKEKKPMSKKKLMMIIILFLIVAGSAAAGYFFMFDKKEPTEEKVQEPPKYDYFSLDADKIESITKIVGYRAIADAYGKDIVFEPLPVDGEEVKKEDDKDTAKKDTTTDDTATEKASADGTATDGQQTAPEETKATYVYTDIETASADVKQYVTYLMDKLGFKEVFPFYIDSPAGYISLSKDSATEGYTIQIDIDYTKDDYTCILQKIKKPEEKKTANKTISRKAALDIIKETPIEVLGINESLDNLILVGEPGHSTVDGMDCYGVHVYKNTKDNKSTVILGTYYVASDRKTIYKYDVMNNSYTKIK